MNDVHALFQKSFAPPSQPQPCKLDELPRDPAEIVRRAVTGDTPALRALARHSWAELADRSTVELAIRPELPSAPQPNQLSLF